jgi:hypothetical protein
MPLHKVHYARLTVLINKLMAGNRSFEAKFSQRKIEENFVLEGIAFDIQSLYTKTEEVFKYIAKVVDDGVPFGDGWQQELLGQMVSETEDRLPVVSRAPYFSLTKLKNFRDEMLFDFALSQEDVIELGFLTIETIKLVCDDFVAFINDAPQVGLEAKLDAGGMKP